MTPEWLHTWNWNCSEYPNGLVILAFASEPFFAQLSGRNPKEYTASITKGLPWLPGFSGMVYAMRKRQELHITKVGRAIDAWKRLAQSPWTPELGYTSHEDRVEDAVLFCFNVPASTVENALHNRLGPPLKIEGRGNEWFKGGTKRIIRALNDIMDDKDAKIWLDVDVSDIRSLFAFNDEPSIQFFADVGELEHIYKRRGGVDVVSSVWCSVQFSTNKTCFLTPFYSFSENDSNHVCGNLIEELRSFSVDACHIEPDVININGRLKGVPPDQYVIRSELVRAVSPNEDPVLDHNLNEWEIDDEIYEIEFLVRIFVLERFCHSGCGALWRESYEQFFLPIANSFLSKMDLDKKVLQGCSFLPLSRA